MPVVTLDVASAALRGFTGRVGQALPLGNEGCGVVVQAAAEPQRRRCWARP
ncbi:MAG: hypothetical protein WDN76_10560 [Alphaproteobacteria bacterium]